MNNSALDSLKQIQEGLSLVSFSSLIDNVLLVEGKTDAEFYKNLICIIIHYGSPNEKNCIDKIIKDKRKVGKNIYGIIDKDYKNHAVESELKKYIFVIDSNSLETMIIKYVGADSFEKLIRSLFYKTKFIKNNFTEDALKWAFFIGYLRKENEQKQLYLNFKKIKHGNDFLKDFLFLSNDKYEFDEERFQGALIQDKNVHLNYIIRDYNKDEAWDICQGHDIIDFIDALNRMGNNNKRNINTIIPQWEYEILKEDNKIGKKIIALFKENYKNSDFKKWIENVKLSNPI